MNLIQFIRRCYGGLMTRFYHYKFHNIHKSARVHYTADVYNSTNLIMAENTNIDAKAVIMNGRAKLIMKKNSGAAIGLLVVTGNHMSVVGMSLKQVTNRMKEKLDINHELDKDVIVGEDVWIASRVTLLSGTQLGRGCEIGAGSVVRGKVPPYAVVVGNPAKVVGFRFTPEEIIEHEKHLYEEIDRLPVELLYDNYEKFFLNRIKEIKQFNKL